MNVHSSFCEFILRCENQTMHAYIPTIGEDVFDISNDVKGANLLPCDEVEMMMIPNKTTLSFHTLCLIASLQLKGVFNNATLSHSSPR